MAAPPWWTAAELDPAPGAGSFLFAARVRAAGAALPAGDRIRRSAGISVGIDQSPVTRRKRARKPVETENA
jgi:hypothetical protein